MDNKTICELFESSVEASDFKKSFMCAQESLREGLMSSPWPVLVYALSVICVAFLIQRVATSNSNKSKEN